MRSSLSPLGQPPRKVSVQYYTLRLNEEYRFTVLQSSLVIPYVSAHRQQWACYLMLRDPAEKPLIRGKELTRIDPKVVEIAGSRKPTLVPDAALQSFLHSPSILQSSKHLSTSTVRIRFSAQPARLIPARLYPSMSSIVHRSWPSSLGLLHRSDLIATGILTRRSSSHKSLASMF